MLRCLLALSKVSIIHHISTATVADYCLRWWAPQRGCFGAGLLKAGGLKTGSMESFTRYMSLFLDEADPAHQQKGRSIDKPSLIQQKDHGLV